MVLSMLSCMLFGEIDYCLSWDTRNEYETMHSHGTHADLTVLLFGIRTTERLNICFQQSDSVINEMTDRYKAMAL